jgi:hypothetical protein
MTEEEWRECRDPRKLLGYLHRTASERKRRLFAAACCRRVWHLLGDRRSRFAVVTAERYADGRATRAELSRAEEEANDAFAAARDDEREVARLAANAVYAVTCAGVGWDFARCAAEEAVEAVGVAAREEMSAAKVIEVSAQLALLRCVFGNPFWAVEAEPAWRTQTVMALAQAAYEERELPAGTLDPARLAVLADALEEGSCTAGELLGHLRGPGPHVRGCWPVDLILGME